MEVGRPEEKCIHARQVFVDIKGDIENEEKEMAYEQRYLCVPGRL